MTPQAVSRSLPGSRREDRVPTRRGKAMATLLKRGHGNMAQKGRGIFMVYVDIDTRHVQEFNEWYNRNIYRNCCRCPAFSRRPAMRRSRVARSTWPAMSWKAWRG